jgi:hypothetical protein
MRESVGEDALALDQPGIAVGGLLGRTPPVDEHDRFAAPCQMDCGGDADDSGSENDDIRLHPAPHVLVELGDQWHAGG